LHPCVLRRMVEPFITYIRTLRFIGPELEKRYFRIFGDLEYDLLALRIETSVMHYRLREVKRRMKASLWISAEDERVISVTSHELNEHLYDQLERLHHRITEAKSFRYDQERERQGFFLLNDIAMAILGLEDSGRRESERETLDQACDAYSRLDISELLDLHDSVQQLLALERRDEVDLKEREQWEERLEEILGRYPLRYARVLETPDGIENRMEKLKRKIAEEQERLEGLGMVYTGAIRSMRFRN